MGAAGDRPFALALVDIAEADAGFLTAPAPRDRLSFPSGHTMTLAATLTPFACCDRAFWLPSAFAVGAMSWARVACGHHYPSDVGAGVAMGFAIASLASLVLPGA